MAGIKLSVPRIIFPSNTKELCIGVCIDAYDADIIINIEDGINDILMVFSGCDSNTSLVIQKHISEFLIFAELTNKKISIEIRNIQSVGILEQPSYLSFCLLFALNQFFKQVLERDSFEEFCYNQGLMVQEAMCAYYGGLLLFNRGTNRFLKLYTADGVFISLNKVSNNVSATWYQIGDLISTLMALDRSDFDLMKSITSLYFPEESDNDLMVFSNLEKNTIYKITQLKEDDAEFYKINRTGLEIS